MQKQTGLILNSVKNRVFCFSAVFSFVFSLAILAFKIFPYYNRLEKASAEGVGRAVNIPPPGMRAMRRRRSDTAAP